MLGRRVGGGKGKAGLACLAGDVDDATAPPGRDHRGGGVAGQEHRGAQVDAQDGIKVAVLHVDQRAKEIADSGVVHEDVDPAQGIDAGRDDPCRRGIVQQVAGHRLDPRTRFGPDGGGGGGKVIGHADAVGGGQLTFRCAAVVEHHGRALGSEAQGDGLSQSARPACAGDKRRLARQPSHQATLRVVMNRGASAKD